MNEAGPLRDYVAWHEAYGDPESRLSRRLHVVVELLGDALAAAPPGPVRVLSLCAGQGDDVLTVASRHPRGGDLTGRLVELDPGNAAVARQRIAEGGLDALEVVVGDAGSTDACVGAVPADLVVVCGIFGNITLSDIEGTIAALPSLCSPGASVVWTRHPHEPGVLDAVSRAFGAAGFREERTVVDQERMFGVGSHRLVEAPAPFQPDRHLFTFVR